MANVLPGYTYNRNTARFRNTATGQFVARTRITDLLDVQVRGAEQRLGDIIQAVSSKQIAPGTAQLLMRDEMRRLSLSNAALGKGGFDRLTFADYGRAGRQLRDTYVRMANLVRDVNNGKVSLPQAFNRIAGYVGEARQNFYAAERDALRQTGRTYEEIRRLGAAEHCPDCITFAARGWRSMGELPIPGQDSECGARCRCRLDRREVTPEMIQERLGRQLERMMA